MLCNIIATPPCTPLLKHNNNIVNFKMSYYCKNMN